MATTIAVIAPGAMGAAVGGRLAAHGATVLTSLTGRSPASASRAEAAGMVHADDDRLATADLILSIVPPDQALPLASRLAAAIGPSRPIPKRPIYVDLNAVNPATAREIGHALAPSGARYVDGSIIGYPPRADGTGPTLYLAGEAAPEAAQLETLGLTTRVLDGAIGAASALKMTYAGLTKGFLALGTAMVLAAEREGAAAALHAELARSQPEFLARLARGLPDMLPKAYRWVPEMHEIAALLGDSDPASPIYRAIANLYATIAADPDGPTAQTLRTFAP